MDDASLTGSAERRARRLAIGTRLVLYPLALGLVVFAWQHYRHDSPDIEQWAGSTGQGQVMRVTTVDGQLRLFSAPVLAPCSSGPPFTFRLSIAPQRFVQRGEHVHAHYAAAGRTDSRQPLRFEAEVWARVGEHPRGTLDLQVRLPGEAGWVVCESRGVTFALHRAS